LLANQNSINSGNIIACKNRNTRFAAVCTVVLGSCNGIF